MTTGTFLLIVLCLGALCGLRTFTPLAILTIALHQDRLTLAGTPLAFLATMTAHVIIILLAIGELVMDKLPSTPSRLRPPALIGRALFGAVTAVAFAFAHHHSIAVPLILGMVGALLGSFIGHRLRSGLVRALKSPDWPVALLEDAICIIGSYLFIMHT
jgi:uncharacterized membrane protein